MSKIQWTDATWNPVRGCSRVSEGCRNCYAERIAARFSGPGKPFDGFAEIALEARWTGRVELIPEKLEEPLHWKKPRRVFVNSMSDLFHEKLSDANVERVFNIMERARRHTFQVLTKRPGRMMRFAKAWGKPVSNVWLGVSVENQATADERIPLLLQMPARVRFVSYEPALGPVNFEAALPGSVTAAGAGWNPINWIIIGGESGPGARPFDLAWARSAVAQCRAAGVPVFVKQLGRRVYGNSEGALVDRWIFSDGSEWQPPIIGYDGARPGHAVGFKLFDAKGGQPDQWPEDLRVREFPS